MLDYKLNTISTKIFSLSFALIFLNSVAWAQSFKIGLPPEKKITEFFLNHWTTNNGLPSNSLNSILQSKKGYLWIGTYNGLVRFDGESFLIYNKTNIPELKTNGIYKMFDDKSGTIWVGTQGSGLLKCKDGEFTTYYPKNDVNISVFCVLVDNKGIIWVGTVSKGVYQLKNNVLEKVDYSGLTDTSVLDIVQDKNGVIWFATPKKGITRFIDGKYETFTSKNGLSSKNITSLFASSDGSLWIGTTKGLNKYVNGLFSTVAGTEKYRINDVIEDHYKSLWFATGYGLFRKNGITGDLENFSEAQGLPSREIGAIAIDKENSLWMGSNRGGLSRLKEGKFYNLTTNDGLATNRVNAIFQLSDDKYLMGSSNGKVNILDQNKISDFKLKTQFPKYRIRDFYKDKKDNLWISSYKGLLKVKDGKEKLFTTEEGLPSNDVRFVFEDKSNVLWIATRYGLAKYHNENKIQIINKTNGLGSNFIMSLDEDKQGNLIIGTNGGGLNIIEKSGNIKNFSSDNGLPGTIIFNTYIDNEDILWICTNGGLSCFHDNKFNTFTIKSGLPIDAYFDILEDDIGNLWLSSAIGVVRIKKSFIKEYQKGKINSIPYTLFDNNDGMINKECIGAVKSMKAKDGKLWFPTFGGIAIIDPTNIPLNTLKPPIIITQMQVDDTNIKLKEGVSLNPRGKRYLFKYTALSLMNPSKVRFKYQLIGFDEEWQTGKSIRSASYTNLSYGNYTFKVIACNNDGIWNKEGASFNFTITPHYYERPIFYLLMIISLSILIYGGYKWRVVSIKKKNKELEELVVKRTAEIRHQKEEIEVQSDKLKEANLKIIQRNQEIKKANILIRNKNKALSSANNLLEEKVKYRTKELDHFVYRSAHDLRGPITRLLGLCYLYKLEHNESINRIDYINKLEGTSHEMEQMLTKLLRAHEIKDQKTEYTEININNLIREILNTYKDIINSYGIKIKVIIEEEVIFWSDRVLLTILIENLIHNSIQYSHKSRTDSFIEISARITEDSKIHISIKDNGVGIDREVTDKIFDMFFVGTELSKGSGLGLYEANLITSKLSGEISHVHKKDKITEFQIFLPLPSEVKEKLNLLAN